MAASQEKNKSEEADVAAKEPVRRSGRLLERPQVEPAAKKPAVKKPVDEKKGKKGGKGKKEEKPEAAPAENGETKTEEETDGAEPTAEEKE